MKSYVMTFVSIVNTDVKNFHFFLCTHKTSLHLIVIDEHDDFYYISINILIPYDFPCCFCLIKDTRGHILLINEVKFVWVINASPGHYICCKCKTPTYLNPQIIVVLEHFAICGERKNK